MATALIPLEQRTIPITKNGVQKDAPALHKMWRTTRSWTRYTAPPSATALQVPGAKDAWIYEAKKVDGDLTWLLRLPAHKFWSQLMNDDDLQKCLEKILQMFPRQHDFTDVTPDPH